MRLQISCGSACIIVLCLGWIFLPTARLNFSLAPFQVDKLISDITGSYLLLLWHCVAAAALPQCRLHHWWQLAAGSCKPCLVGGQLSRLAGKGHQHPTAISVKAWVCKEVNLCNALGKAKRGAKASKPGHVRHIESCTGGIIHEFAKSSMPSHILSCQYNRQSGVVDGVYSHSEWCGGWCVFTGLGHGGALS